MTDQELQKIAENTVKEVDIVFLEYRNSSHLKDQYDKEYIENIIIKSLTQVRDAQEEKLEYIKEELEVALGKCHGSLEYPVGTIIKQLISKIGGGE